MLKNWQDCGSLEEVKLGNSIKAGTGLTVILPSTRKHSIMAKATDLADQRMVLCEAYLLACQEQCTSSSQDGHLSHRHEVKPNSVSLEVSCAQYGLLVTKLPALFQSTHELHSLALKCSINNPNSAKKLITSLSRSQNLQILDLSNNQIGPEEIRVIATGLLYPARLKELLLNNNFLYSEGVIILSKHLQDYRLLRKLSLRNNGISSNGVQVLAANLHHCIQLQYLNLKENDISKEAIHACLNHCKQVVHERTQSTKLIVD